MAAKNETIYAITINYDLIPICFQTAELSGEAAPQKSMILQLNRVYNKDHHPFFSPMFHVECENHVSGVKSEKFCYCSYHLCNYQKKISESIPLMLGLSLLVTALASWRGGGRVTVLISWHVYCSVLVLSSLGAKYNKFAVIHAWRNGIDHIPETIWY